MRITDIKARVIKIARPEDAFSGGAGVSGAVQRGVGSAYQILRPYPTVYSRNVETLIVEVETDTGIVGVGEGQFPVVPEAGAVIVESLFRPLLLGLDPRPVMGHYQTLYGLMNCRGHTTGLMLDAIAAVDNALWDLCGKSEGEAVCRLLGGAPTRIPLYLSGLQGDTLERRIAFAREYLDRGFSALKLFLGKGVEHDIAEVRGIREALGGEVAILVDVQWMYEPEQAIELGEELQRLGVTFLETPCAPEDLDGAARVAERLELPVALGECERSRHQFREVLRRSAADVLQPDIGRTGISEGHAIVELARAHGKQVTLHMGVGLFGYIAAGMQVAAAGGEPLLVEYQPQMFELASSLLSRPFRVEEGSLLLEERPGLGLEVDGEMLRRFEVPPPGGRWSSDAWTVGREAG